jgi:hypothetical protein
MVPLWVLEPGLRKAAFWLKRPKTRDLSLLADKVHEHQQRKKSMRKQQFIKTAICEKYQTLLEECQSALEKWNEHRAEVSQSRLVRKEAGDELLRLQAKYARAYTMLQNHAHNCSFCQLVARLEGRDSENSSNAHSGSAVYR